MTVPPTSTNQPSSRPLSPDMRGDASAAQAKAENTSTAMTNKTGCSEHQMEKPSVGGRETDIGTSPLHDILALIKSDFEKEAKRLHQIYAGDDRRLNCKLAELRRDYFRTCDPFVKQLAAIDALKPPRAIIFDDASTASREHAENNKV